MRTSGELRYELRRAEEREAKAKIECTSCDGKGWVNDTTYDRSGNYVRCRVCYGTGLPSQDVEHIIAAALKEYLKPSSEERRE